MQIIINNPRLSYSQKRNTPKVNPVIDWLYPQFPTQNWPKDAIILICKTSVASLSFQNILVDKFIAN